MAFLVLLMICYFFKSSSFGLLIPLRRDMRNLIVQGTHLQPPSLSFLLPVQQFLLSILLAAAELLPIGLDLQPSQQNPLIPYWTAKEHHPVLKR